MLEGGGALATTWLRARVVDRLARFTAPRILGEGLPWCGPIGRPLGGRLLEQARLGADLYELYELEA
jgi:riboflavin biosynthesis pyrimidine reductase